MNIKLLKLAKMIMRLGEIATDKATLIYDGKLAVDVEVFVEKDGEIVIAEDGEYETETQIISVAGGKVVGINDKVTETEPTTEDEVKVEEEEVIVEPIEEITPTEDEKDLKIKELEDKIAELEAIITERDKTIEELNAKIETTNVEMAKQQTPVFEELEKNTEKTKSIAEVCAEMRNK